MTGLTANQTQAPGLADQAALALLAGLNPAQARAVSAADGPLLVLAGAGSGKTRVLTHRIAYLLTTRRTYPDRVLAVTFTNKAAREMRQRLEGLLGAPPRGMWVGTFHAVCARMLREHGDLLGIRRDFVIYDELDRLAVVREAMKLAGIDEKRTSAAAVVGEISRAKNELMAPGEYAAGAFGFVEAQVARVYPAYQEMLQRSGALDFDDLLWAGVRLVRESEAARGHYQERFQQVLVDEYQDTNRAQYHFLRELVEQHHHITVVGDPDQSVYSWRGADLRNILEFQQDYPDALVVPLEQNYRSTKAILRAAQAVIVENAERLEKDLWTDGPEGAPVVVAQLYDEREEATAVAREIRRLVDLGDLEFAEAAILYRTNAQSRALEETLLRAEIPYRLVGGVRFYQRREVKDVLSYLRLLALPLDRLSLERVVNVPKRGVGAQSLAQLRQRAQEQGLAVWDLLRAPEQFGVRGAAAKGLRAFRQLVEELTEWSAPWPLVTVIDHVLERTGYRAYLRDGSPEGDERWANVMELRGLAAEYGDQPALEALPMFLERSALAGEVDQMEDEVRAVTLITLHQVKGLEFPAVFVTGVEEGLLPHGRSLDSLAQLEEERRLLYVGMTRAKRRLYLSHCFRRHLYGSPSPAIPSRFLEPLGRGAGVESWDVSGSDQPAGAYVLPVAARSQPLPLRRAREVMLERVLAPAPAAPAVQRFQAGDKVEHARFGRGTIERSELGPSGEEVVIRFTGAGVRRFAVSDAVLRRLDR